MSFEQFLEQKARKCLRVGVVGYSTQKFDENKARQHIREAFDVIAALPHKATCFECVSGLTDLGIPALAYREAEERGWKTVGIACKLAGEYELFPVDEKIIVGDKWGDESDRFLSSIDVMVKVGGGKQSEAEAKKMRDRGAMVIEFALKAD